MNKIEIITMLLKARRNKV